MFENKLTLDRSCPTPLHVQIKDGIRDLILKGEIPEGQKLPPTRRLAQRLGVNRSTVVTAYSELGAEGLTEARVGRGTVIVGAGRGEPLRRRLPLQWKEHLVQTPGTLQDSIIKDQLDECADERLSTFSVGMPDPATYPTAAFERIYRRLLKDSPRDMFSSLPTEGYPPLREFLAEGMGEIGRASRPEETMIVSGAMQGLALVTRALLREGDLVVVERPTFMGALKIFQAAGARIIDIPMDGSGLRLDVLESLLSRQSPKFIYTLPTFQNPTGAVLSPERRRGLIELAARSHVPVVEDDPYSRIYFGAKPPLSLKSMDPGNFVIYIGTFSKILFPGLRVGWVCADRDVIARLAREKQIEDLHTNTPAQYVLDDFCRGRGLAGHLDVVRRTYAPKRDAMLLALERHCSASLEWNIPQGGFYVWCTLRNGLRARALQRLLYEDRVSFLSGDVFFHGSGGQSSFRLSFSFPSLDEIEAGVRAVQKAVKKLSKITAARAEEPAASGRPIV